MERRRHPWIVDGVGECPADFVFYVYFFEDVEAAEVVSGKIAIYAHPGAVVFVFI